MSCSDKLYLPWVLMSDRTSLKAITPTETRGLNSHKGGREAGTACLAVLHHRAADYEEDVA